MITPFEFFRTPIQIRRFTQGFYLNGIWQEGSQVVLSGNFVSGNVINITLNGIALSPIDFTTNQLATMTLIQNALLAQPNIITVDITNNNLTLTIVPLQPSLSVVNSFTVTGGSSQPVVTILNSPTIISATASIQPTKGIDIELVPDGRRDKETYLMYTSTQIFGITNQNPNQNQDQVTVLKGPFTGIVFEVIEIVDWQNNSHFNITNHYKYLALRLNPLP
jgi:hypothetical protein